MLLYISVSLFAISVSILLILILQNVIPTRIWGFYCIILFILFNMKIDEILQMINFANVVASRLIAIFGKPISFVIFLR